MNKVIKVYCKDCKEYFDEEKVGFRGIEEDMEGRDVLFFYCPKCKKEQHSLRMG